MKHKKKRYVIDPPDGWRYGFPKAVDKIEEDVKQQCIDLGYPKELAEKYDDVFFIRFWEE